MRKWFLSGRAKRVSHGRSVVSVRKDEGFVKLSYCIQQDKTGPRKGAGFERRGGWKKEDDKKYMRGKTEEQHLLPVGVIRHQTHWRKSLETWRGFLLNVKLASFCLSDYLIHTENFSFLGGKRNLKRIYLKYRLVLACLVCMLSYCLGAYYSG